MNRQFSVESRESGVECRELGVRSRESASSYSELNFRIEGRMEMWLGEVRQFWTYPIKAINMIQSMSTVKNDKKIRSEQI